MSDFPFKSRHDSQSMPIPQKKKPGILRLGFLDLKSHQFVKYGNVYFLGGS